MSDLLLLHEGIHPDPHRFLGLFSTPCQSTIRLFRPEAEELFVEVRGQMERASRIDPLGLFEWQKEGSLARAEYRIFYPNGLLSADPYAFPSLLGELDLFLFNKGCHYELYKVLGAHLTRCMGVEGVHFALWAPNALGVLLLADFNHWDGRLFPMRSLGSSGIWELFVPGLVAGEKYKFAIKTKEGETLFKSDPLAFYSELRPNTASIVSTLDFSWSDASWQKGRGTLSRPIQIYEVHLGSWFSLDSGPPSYRTLAPLLADYCLDMGFTHLEVMPLMEHPLDESWGYQVSGFFSVTSRYGHVADFQFFVNHLHEKGVGVILDWVPGHFPLDDFALGRFDGTPLYEHADPRQGLHPHWHTALFNYGRVEVSNFLIASALFWLEVMHVDGLRVDAVASMLYLDYGRKSGEWIPNADGTHFNREAIEFLRHLNSIVHQRSPRVLMIAEESSAFPQVTHSIESGGLGFDLKWNMGWMNDTLRYVSRDPLFRKYHQSELTFSLCYAFSEQFALPLSHDEVVHGKKSLFSKMPGPPWQQFAGVRLLYSFLMCHPGKKHLFMGGEWGMQGEWDVKGFLDLTRRDDPMCRALSDMVRSLNHLALRSPPLWERDFQWEGFSWVDCSDTGESLLTFLRKGRTTTLLCLHHFIPETREGYPLPLSHVARLTLQFNTDAVRWGGSGQGETPPLIYPDHIVLTLPPLATLIFAVEFV